MAHEWLSLGAYDQLIGLLRASDELREVWLACGASELVRPIYDRADIDLPTEWILGIGHEFSETEIPSEVCRSGRTIGRWVAQTAAWHRSHVMNGPTKVVNNLTKRAKRAAFKLANLHHSCVR